MPARPDSHDGCITPVNLTSPSLRADDEIQDCPRRVQVTIHQLARVSTTLFRPKARTDNDKVAPSCNEAARPERDCSRAATACLHRYGEVSKQNAMSTGIRRVKPSQRTRFASQSAVDRVRRTAAADLDHPAWL